MKKKTTSNLACLFHIDTSLVKTKVTTTTIYQSCSTNFVCVLTQMVSLFIGVNDDNDSNYKKHPKKHRKTYIKFFVTKKTLSSHVFCTKNYKKMFLVYGFYLFVIFCSFIFYTHSRWYKFFFGKMSHLLLNKMFVHFIFIWRFTMTTIITWHKYHIEWKLISFAMWVEFF